MLIAVFVLGALEPRLSYSSTWLDSWFERYKELLEHYDISIPQGFQFGTIESGTVGYNRYVLFDSTRFSISADYFLCAGRYQLYSYSREIERYGGPAETLLLCQHLIEGETALDFVDGVSNWFRKSCPNAVVYPAAMFSNSMSESDAMFAGYCDRDLPEQDQSSFDMDNGPNRLIVTRVILDRTRLVAFTYQWEKHRESGSWPIDSGHYENNIAPFFMNAVQD